MNSMMFREVNYLKLQDYISAAWRYDSKLPQFYDKALSDKTYEQMVMNTVHKISDLYAINTETVFYGVDIDSVNSGFIVIVPKLNLLYSFGLNIKHRNAECLKYYFRFICSKFKDYFYCLLYNHNTRAIKWLKKCGMKQDDTISTEPNIVYLKFNLCQ